ncbi:hypothetical protein Ancab_009079 [Ancistrocladus abbreviatus]
MMMMNDMLAQLGPTFTTILFLWAGYQQFLPAQVRETIRHFLTRHAEKLVILFSPYLTITFEEYTGERFNRSELYSSIETYLSESSLMKARRLKASTVKDGKSLVLSIAENEEITDEYKGAKVWWSSNRTFSKSHTISIYPGTDEKRFYRLTFHRKNRDLITSSYLNYVMEQGKAIAVRHRQRKLFTNTRDFNWYSSKWTMWSHVEFKHPGRFETLAMDPTKKQQIIDDLMRFRNAKDFYDKIGKAWKRGYLLYGPPGTGKSTMIAAMANLLEYDVYDLELTAVKDNIQLRRLLIETTSKSIIVIEDIDCSVDLTGQRKKKKDKDDTKGEEDPLKKKLKEDDEQKGSHVTLSGLLNVIDGIWSSCGEERLIIFTTNFIEKLDPALIRRGRMDMHIEMSYCGFEAFKVLAKNYLDLDSHDLFPTIKRLLEETNMIPADVAENLMPKSSNVDVNVCLENLVKELEKAKEDAKLKAEEERKLKEKEAEEERKLKEKEAEEEKKLKEKEVEAKKAIDAEVAKEKKTSDDELKGKEENKDGESEKN